MNHLEYCVQVQIGDHWQPVTEYGRAMVFSDPGAAVDLNATLNDQCAEHPHRVAVREVSPWCEMKRGEVR